TIYIDVDDEITSIIEKVGDSKHKIVALVLPKRAAVLQSIVNMKLLKRTGDADKKRVVLITSEAGLLPLAGAVGLHVAKTLQSKPAIPPPPDMSSKDEALVDASDDEPDEEPDLDDSKSIGELAGVAAVAGAAAAKSDPEETIDVDNTDDEPEGKSKKGKKGKKDSKIKVPNFDKFRLKLIAGAAAFILLIVLWFVAANVLPKATVVIQTDNQSVNESPSFTANTAAKTVDVAAKVVPAEIKDVKETDTQKVPATGKKNNGTKATGNVTMTTCISGIGLPQSVPAGTGISANGLTFITQQNTDFSHTGTNNGNCIAYQATGPTSVAAQAPGSQYNIGPSNFSVSGYPNVSASSSSTMTGGTDSIVIVVAQADIDGAKQKIASNTDKGKADLTKALKTDNKLPLPATLVADDPAVTTSANVGDQVSDVTVTAVTTYHMLGVNQDDLQKLVANDVKGKIDTTKQAISDYGLGVATFTFVSKKSNTEQTLTLQTTVVAGAQINASNLKKQLAGKKKGDATDLIEGLPSVQKATVSFSPFWVSKVPSKASRVTITVEKPQAKANASTSP
ncbi:MAG TPA: hypothetical protein VLF90_01290, partial [Patescibacteria group bacterium]|nr:hypothetical protein [Patescibacteria group bacterium]